MRPVMMRVAAAFFQNREDAEDAVQDAMLKLLRRGSGPTDDLEALAVRVTRNECVSLWRRQRVRKGSSLPDAVIGTDRADAAAESTDAAARLEDAIRRLPRSEQRLIRLRQDGFESDEIAAVTGIPLRSVRTMISSARKRIFAFLNQEP